MFQAAYRADVQDLIEEAYLGLKDQDEDCHCLESDEQHNACDGLLPEAQDRHSNYAGTGRTSITWASSSSAQTHSSHLPYDVAAPAVAAIRIPIQRQALDTPQKRYNQSRWQESERLFFTTSRGSGRIREQTCWIEDTAAISADSEHPSERWSRRLSPPVYTSDCSCETRSVRRGDQIYSLDFWAYRWDAKSLSSLSLQEYYQQPRSR